MSDDKAVFIAVDVATLPSDVKKKWETLQKAQAATKAAKEEFEASFLSSAKKMERIDKDVQLAFGYRFGGLAIAKVTNATKKSSTSTKPKFTF